MDHWMNWVMDALMVLALLQLSNQLSGRPVSGRVVGFVIVAIGSVGLLCT